MSQLFVDLREMEVIDDSELWMTDEEEFEDGEPDADPTSFTVKLERSGQAGGNGITPLLLTQTSPGGSMDHRRDWLTQMIK